MKLRKYNFISLRLHYESNFVSGPPTPPQIIIEDPDGNQQCDECTAKASQLDNLSSQIKQVSYHDNQYDMSS